MSDNPVVGEPGQQPTTIELPSLRAMFNGFIEQIAKATGRPVPVEMQVNIRNNFLAGAASMFQALAHTMPQVGDEDAEAYVEALEQEFRLMSQNLEAAATRRVVLARPRAKFPKGLM